MPAPSLAAIFAHPDDETFTMGGTLARCAAEGVACHLLCATDGDAGRSSGVPVASREALARLRRQELEAATTLLGVASLTPLGLPDGALAQADQDALIGAIVRLLREQRPETVVTFGPEGGPNTHRDHRVISRAATAAYFLAGVPTAYAEQLADGALAPHVPARLLYCAWQPPTPEAQLTAQSVPVTIRVDVSEWRQAKRDAFEMHRTQHDHRERFEELALRDWEGFALAAGAAPPDAALVQR